MFYEEPLIIFIVESRWHILGHIQRGNEEVPSIKAMGLYFPEFGCNSKGRSSTTLPTVINKDLSQKEPSKTPKTKENLEQLRTVAARDQRRWNVLDKIT